VNLSELSGLSPLPKRKLPVEWGQTEHHDIESLAVSIEPLDLPAILAWAVATLSPRLVMSSTFEPEGNCADALPEGTGLSDFYFYIA
jgi:hypothetical protein